MKILSIGNSFSQDAQRYLYRLAKANGKEIHNVNLYIGGCSLERHSENIDGDIAAYSYEIHGEPGERLISIKEALLSDEWDYVTLQEVSFRSFRVEGFKLYIEKLADYVRKYSKNAKIVLHKTWSYPDFELKRTPFHRTEDMYSRIERVYKWAAEKIGADGIIPSGETLERMMKCGYKVHRDTHASFIHGRYALALTWFEYFFGIDARETVDIELDSTYGEFESSRLKIAAKECAHDAIMNMGNYYYPTVTSHDVSYIPNKHTDDPMQKLDVYFPDKESYPVFVYFHGGGIVSGDKDGEYERIMSSYFTRRGIAFVSANYRMFPNTDYPDFVRDAAAAVAWVKKNLPDKGASGKIFLGGSSAGGYISMMLCFDRKHLGFFDIEPESITGFIHDAGQPTTHFNVLKMRGLDPRRTIIDETAPLYYVGVAKEYAPMLFTLSDNDIKNRKEQTELLLSTMKHFDYDMSKVQLKVFENSTHTSYVKKVEDDGGYEFGDTVYGFMKDLL